jgi:electron transfer flavoprotein beta subunit
MKVLVPVKRVVDYSVRVRVKADGSGIDLNGVKMSMNPFDEIALEEAIRLREKGQVDDVTALSIGPRTVQDTLRAALAMGADKAVHIELPADTPIDSLAVAKLLDAIVREDGYSLVLLGKQAIDTDLGGTGPMLAGLLRWPQASFASELTLIDTHLRVVTETDSGLRTLELPLPAVVSADLRLNTPRYASLPNIMKARSRPITVRTPAELGVDVTPRLRQRAVSPPPARAKTAIRVESAADLVRSLRAEGALK